MSGNKRFLEGARIDYSKIRDYTESSTLADTGTSVMVGEFGGGSEGVLWLRRP